MEIFPGQKNKNTAAPKRSRPPRFSNGARRGLPAIGPPLEMLIPTLAEQLGNFGNILVLLETPSGFAIFSFFGVKLYLPDAMENIWANFVDEYEAQRVVDLKEFKAFEDKSRVISLGTGVNRQLSEMIMKWRHPGERLAVGKPEYKRVIEEFLDVPCLCDDAVMELMWGMKNLMHTLVPEEKLELTKEDRFPMSQGLLLFLGRYGLNVKPEMVNEKIISAVSILYTCESLEEEHCVFLRNAGRNLEALYGIDCEDWNLLKLATALKMICSPHENVAGDLHEMFSKDELSKLRRDSRKYKCKLSMVQCLRSYEDMVFAHDGKIRIIKELGSLIKEAKESEHYAEKKRNAKLKKRKRMRIELVKRGRMLLMNEI